MGDRLRNDWIDTFERAMEHHLIYAYMPSNCVYSANVDDLSWDGVALLVEINFPLTKKYKPASGQIQLTNHSHARKRWKTNKTTAIFKRSLIRH